MTNSQEPKQRLFDLHKNLCAEALDLMRRKNSDYSGSEDPFRNFRLTESAGICSAQQGILMRLLDKVSRLSTHASGQELKTDSRRDAVVDIINYAILFEAMYVLANPSAESGANKGGCTDKDSSKEVGTILR